MLFSFNGQYTHGRTSIKLGNVTFDGRAPSEVTDPDLLRRLRNHPEFDAVTPPVADDEDVKPRKRGRPRKVAD